MLRKAEKRRSPIRFGIMGPSGSGKTYSSLSIATGMAGEEGKIALIDTERGASEKYADQFDFFVWVVEPPYTPVKLTNALSAIRDAGINVVVIDTLSMFWSGEGGLLDIVEDAARRDRNGNSYTAWRHGTPQQNRMLDSILAFPGHVVCTFRSKQEYVLEKDERGKSVPRKVGLAPVQRDNVEYEFDLMAQMDMDNIMAITKSRLYGFSGVLIEQPGASLGERLVSELNKSVVVEERVPDWSRFILYAQRSGVGEDAVRAHITNYAPPVPMIPADAGYLLDQIRQQSLQAVLE